jgi:PPP family 3-phenylpropionic acid transporter
MIKRPILILCLFLFLFNSTMTIITSFLPVYFQFKGFTSDQIGWLLAIGPLSGLIAQPLAGYLSDKWKTVKKLLTFCLVFLSLLSVVMFQVESFYLLLLVSYLFFTFISPIGALGDSLAQKTSNTSNVPFGSIRMWGSIGFASIALLTGKVLSIIGVDHIMFPFLFFSISCAIISLFLSDVTLSKRPVKLGDAATLLKDKRMLIFLFITLFFAIPHRMNDFYIGLYIKEMGGNEVIIGWAWFIGAIVEAFVFLLSSKWVGRFHELTLLIFIGIIYSARYIALSYVNEPIILLFLQPLHGITFAIFYASALQYVSKIVPNYIIGTGHLLLISVFFSISGIFGSLVGGSVLERFGGSTLYLSMGILVLIGSIFMVLYKKSLNLQSIPNLA